MKRFQAITALSSELGIFVFGPIDSPVKMLDVHLVSDGGSDTDVVLRIATIESGRNVTAADILAGKSVIAGAGFVSIPIFGNLTNSLPTVFHVPLDDIEMRGKFLAISILESAADTIHGMLGLF